MDLVNNTSFDNVQTTRIANPAYTLAFAADGEIGLQQSNNIRLLNNICYARGSNATLSIQGGSNITRSNNMHWNANGSVPGSIDVNDIVANPGFVNAALLTKTEANTLATMSNPFNANSSSAQLREPSTTFTTPDLTLTRSGGAVDAGASSGLGLSAPTIDQQHAHRPWGHQVDAGAIEYHPQVARKLHFSVQGTTSASLEVDCTPAGKPKVSMTAVNGSGAFDNLDQANDHHMDFLKFRVQTSESRMHSEDFTRQWTQYQSAVASLCWSIVGDPHGVDDLIQEVAVAALRASDRFDSSRPFLPWVLVIARNRAFDWLRQRGRESAIPLDDANFAVITEASAEIAESLGAREQALQRCMGKLSDLNRDILHKHYRKKMSFKRIAEILHLRTGTLKVRCHRLRNQLRSCIEQHLDSRASHE